MKLLLIVGCANDIFVYNYAKWLKKSMSVSIDIFEFFPSSQQSFGAEYDDSVTIAEGYFLPFRRGKMLIDSSIVVALFIIKRCYYLSVAVFIKSATTMHLPVALFL